MCNFKEIYFWLKNRFVWHRGSYNGPTMLLNCPLNSPEWSPPPSPSPASAKVSCQGATKIRNTRFQTYIYIYIYIYIFQTYTYIRNKYSTNTKIFVQKYAHRFTDHFASLESSVRVDFEG